MDIDDIYKSLSVRYPASTNLRNDLRKRFLEQGLENALQFHKLKVSDRERLELLHGLDPELFPLETDSK